MLQDLPKPVSLFLIVVFILIVGAVSSWLFTHGGAPDEENGVVNYPLRPATRILATLIGLSGLAAIGFGVWALRTPRDLWWMLKVFGGAGLVMSALFILSARLWLDEAGLHYRRGFKRLTTIGWHEFNHYETMVNSDWRTNMSSRTIFFRSVDANSIPVQEAGYAVDDLLRRIQARTHLKEQPYKRRHWYGG